jgi:hypothetical protein
MRVNAISFAYAARFVSQEKSDGVQDHIKGILFEPQASGLVRLVATDGHRMVIVHDGNISIDETRRTWIDPRVNGLLSAAKKGDYVTIRPDGAVEVAKGNTTIYISPVSCENLKRVDEFPPYEQVVSTALNPKTRNYSLNAKYLADFDLGDGVICYPVGGNLDPLLVQPVLKSYGLEIESALGVLMPQRQELENSYKLSEEYIKTFINRDADEKAEDS